MKSRSLALEIGYPRVRHEIFLPKLVDPCELLLNPGDLIDTRLPLLIEPRNFLFELRNSLS